MINLKIFYKSGPMIIWCVKTKVHTLQYDLWMQSLFILIWYWYIEWNCPSLLLLDAVVCFDRYGNAERVYRLEFVSNSDFSDSEFSKWKETVMLQGMTLPTTYEVEQKAKDIKLALEYNFNEDDIEMVWFIFICFHCVIILMISGHWLAVWLRVVCSLYY